MNSPRPPEGAAERRDSHNPAFAFSGRSESLSLSLQFPFALPPSFGSGLGSRDAVDDDATVAAVAGWLAATSAVWRKFIEDAAAAYFANSARGEEERRSRGGGGS